MPPAGSGAERKYQHLLLANAAARQGRILLQRPMWPVKVIVIDIFAQDQP
jgi:hypothetical protein